MECTPSPFIKEIDRQYIKTTWQQMYAKEEPEKRTYHREPAFSDDFSSGDNFSQVATPVMNLKSGDTVRHFQFGQGVIESISGIGTSKQAVVKFNSVGKKKLMLQYAKLVKEVDEF
jgi:hypothetical protein